MDRWSTGSLLRSRSPGFLHVTGFVAWGVNTLSLPLLGFAAVVLIPLPAVDAVFWLGILGSAILTAT